MSDFPPLLLSNLTRLTLVLVMLSLGSTVSFKQVIAFWQRPGLLNRAIVGMSVIVPCLTVLLGFGLNLSTEVKVGLILVSISLGTALPFQYLFKGIKEYPCLKALQATVAFLSVITIPLTLAIVNEFLPANVKIAPLTVVQQLLTIQLFPLLVGVLLHYCHSTWVEQVAKLLQFGAMILIYSLIFWILDSQFDAVLHLGRSPILAISLMVLVSLGLGHGFGGQEVATRMVLALAFSSHNIATALFLAIEHLPSVPVLATIAVYVLISTVLTIAYCKWNQCKPTLYKSLVA